MKTAFVSHAHEEREIADILLDRLAACGHVGITDRRFRPPARILAEVRRSLDNSDVLVCLWTRHAQRSEWVVQEVGIAQELKRPVIYVYLDPQIEPPAGHDECLYVDAHRFYELFPRGEAVWHHAFQVAFAKLLAGLENPSPSGLFAFVPRILPAQADGSWYDELSVAGCGRKGILKTVEVFDPVNRDMRGRIPIDYCEAGEPGPWCLRIEANDSWWYACHPLGSTGQPWAVADFSEPGWCMALEIHADANQGKLLLKLEDDATHWPDPPSASRHGQTDWFQIECNLNWPRGSAQHVRLDRLRVLSGAPIDWSRVLQITFGPAQDARPGPQCFLVRSILFHRHIHT